MDTSYINGVVIDMTDVELTNIIRNGYMLEFSNKDLAIHGCFNHSKR